MKTLKALLTAAALALAANAAFASTHASTAKAGFADGEVRKIDKDAGKVTLKHGPLQALDMPPMTMVFRVKEASMLDSLKVGDKVRFKADKVQGAYTVTEIEPAK
jgi:Cu(I)/Ag(I) efflux system protein CusF